MKKTLSALLILFCSLLISPSSAHATGGGPFGLGVILGEPTGFTGKYWQNNQEAIDFGLTWSFGSYFLVYGDYLWHWKGVINAKGQFFKDLHLYLGAGAVLFVGGDEARRNRRFFTDDGRSAVGIGARIPLGAEWKPGRPPFGVFLELVPGLGVIPSVYGFFQGGIGIRYYF